jgi:PilZ domain
MSAMPLPYLTANPRPPAEKRRSRRFRIELPVMVKIARGGTRRISGTTQDFSVDGVFFYADSRIAIGSSVALFIVLPSEEMVGRRVPLWFDGRVVRVEECPGKRKFGIAVAFRPEV